MDEWTIQLTPLHVFSNLTVEVRKLVHAATSHGHHP